MVVMVALASSYRFGGRAACARKLLRLAFLAWLQTKGGDGSRAALRKCWGFEIGRQANQRITGWDDSWAGM